jgi:hypothetical protein
MRMRSKLAARATLLFLLAAALSLGSAARAGAQTCNATNDPSIAIIRTADLNFGELGATATAGTAVIDAATGGRTVTGGVVGTGTTFNAAAFAILLCGVAGPKRFDILLPAGAVTLAGPSGATMTVDTFTANPGPTNISGSTITTTGVSVGGTLYVGANQTPGSYTGTFSVIVARQ